MNYLIHFPQAAVVEEQKVATEKKGRKRKPTKAESPAKGSLPISFIFNIN